MAISVLMLNSCGEPKTDNAKEKSKPTSKTEIELDTKNQVEKKLVSEEGGSLALKTDDGASIRIVFPQGSLGKDSSLVAAPLANQPLKGSSIKGFSLEEKGTGKGPSMSGPAFVVITADRELPENTSIVRLAGDGYEVVPTAMKAEKGRTVLSATLSHFSAYTTTEITPEQIAEADEARKSQAYEKDYDWVIYVKDTVEHKSGPFDTTVSLDLRAVNTSGGLGGTYRGSIKGTAKNSMNIPGGMANAPFVISSDNLIFDLAPTLAPLAPLGESKEEEGPLAPLTTDNETDYEGHGTIEMTSKGSMNVQSMGYYGSKAAPSTTTSIPFEVTIIGPWVRLALVIPQGTIYFDGYIIGEGKGARKPEPKANKKNPPKGNDDLAPLAPLEPLGDLAPLEPYRANDDLAPLAPLEPLGDLAPLEPLN